MILVGDSLGQVDARLRERRSGSRWPRCSTTPRRRPRARSARSSIGDMPFLSLRHGRRGDRERRPVHARGRAPRRSRSRAASAARASSRRSSRPASRSMGHIGWTPQAASTAGRQGPGPGQDPRRGPGAPRRRARDPGGGRLRDRPRARAGAARRGDHRAAADPDDRHRRRRRLQRPGPGDHRPARPRRLAPEARRPTPTCGARSSRRPRRLCRRRPAGTFPGPAETVRMDDARARRGARPDASDRGVADHPAGSRSTATCDRLTDL